MNPPPEAEFDDKTSRDAIDWWAAGKGLALLLAFLAALGIALDYLESAAAQRGLTTSELVRDKFSDWYGRVK